MISPISFKPSYTANFQGIKSKKEQTSKTNEQKSSSGYSVGTRAAAGLVALSMPFVMSACSKKAETNHVPETTTSIGQRIEEERELESARREAQELERQSEKEEMEEYSRIEEEYYKQNQEALINKNGIDYYVNLDLDDDNTREAYKEIKNVLQNLGQSKVAQLINASGEYGLDPVHTLVLATQQGGIPELSDLALEETAKKYSDIDYAGKIDKFVAFFSICSERAGGDLNKAVELFTGSKQDVDKYADIYKNLTGSMIEAIADNDALKMYQATQE